VLVSGATGGTGGEHGDRFRESGRVAGRKRKRGVRALGKAGAEVFRKFRAAGVVFAVLFGVRGKWAERRVAGNAQHVPLPGAEPREAGRWTGDGDGDGADRGPMMVVGVDVLHRPVLFQGDQYDWEAFVRAGGRVPGRDDCTCVRPRQILRG
jgi:hypothetical protein